MRILLIGDIHGNIEALETCLMNSKNENIDRVNVLGDIVGYMANPNECIERVKTMECISGNHDSAVYNDKELEQFNPFACRAILWTREHIGEGNLSFLKSLPSYKTYYDENYTIAHGSIIDPYMYLEYESQVRLNVKFMPTDLLFVGHTHIPAFWCVSTGKSTVRLYHAKVNELEIEYGTNIPLQRDKKYIINIGSVGQPRDKNPKGCCLIYDSDEYYVKFLRFEYPVDKTIEKIKNNGLPEFLHKRLLSGE